MFKFRSCLNGGQVLIRQLMKPALAFIISSVLTPLALADSLSVTSGLVFFTDGDDAGDYVGWRYARDIDGVDYGWGVSGGLASATGPRTLSIWSGLAQSGEEAYHYSHSSLYHLDIFGSYQPAMLDRRLRLDLGLGLLQANYDQTASVAYSSSDPESTGPIAVSPETRLGLSTELGVTLVRGEHLQLDSYVAMNGIQLDGPAFLMGGLQVGAHW